MNRRQAFKNTALLLGVTASSSTLVSLLQSCQEQSRLNWKPKFFSMEQAEIVSEIVDTILPRTDTVGAIDLKVDIFVDLMMKEYLSSEDQKHVLKGFDNFEALCQRMVGKSFVKMNNEERHQVLTKAEAEANTFNMQIWGGIIGTQKPIDFYRRVKEFTLVGYYTSQFAGEKVEDLG